MKERFIVRISGELIEVTEEVYREFYTHLRKERTQRERDARNRLVHYDAWDTDRGTGAEAVASPDLSPEEIVLFGMYAEKLRKCIAKLEEGERDIIHALFFCGETLSSLSRRLNIPRKTLEGRRSRILRKLRIYFDAPDR